MEQDERSIVSADVSSECRCKVGRTIDSYDFSEMNEDLAERWTGRNGDRHSLRSLERYFNERVLSTAMWDAGMSPLEGEVSNIYELLTDAERSGIEARRRLERNGVDVDQVTSDFVSHQTIHNHLRDCCDVERTEETANPVEKARNTVVSIQNRLTAVTENTLERLDRIDALSLGEFSVFVSVQITCEECGQYYTIAELLDEGGCHCQLEERDETDEQPA